MKSPGTNPLEIKKRDGRVVAFDRSKIVTAIMKAAQSLQGSDYRLAEELTDLVVTSLSKTHPDITLPSVERVQDVIEKTLIEQGHARTAKAFILYRAKRSRIRETQSAWMNLVAEKMGNQPSEGEGPMSAAKHHAVGCAAARDFYLHRVLRDREAEAHRSGSWFMHALSHYDLSPHSASLALAPALKSGFHCGHSHLRASRRLASLPALTSALVHAFQNEVHGGGTIPHFESAWADLIDADVSSESIDGAVEALAYHLNTSLAVGARALPRITLQIGLDTRPQARAITSALLTLMGREDGQNDIWGAPHVTYCLKEGVNLAPGDPNHDLTKLALAAFPHASNMSFSSERTPAWQFGQVARLADVPAAPCNATIFARLSINLPRLILQSKRQGFETTAALQTTIAEAYQHLTHRLESLARRPARAFPILLNTHLPGSQPPGAEEALGDRLGPPLALLNLVGLSEAVFLLSGVRPEASPSARAEGVQLIKTAAHCTAELCSSGKLQVHLQCTEAPLAASHFARLDRREFGIIKDVTDRPRYTTGLPGVDVSSAKEELLATEATCARLLSGGSWSEWPEGLPQEQALDWLQRGYHEGIGGWGRTRLLVACPACRATLASTESPGCPVCGSTEPLTRVPLPHAYWESDD
ncbi:MAG: anaerobic ribonucleoside-triphosphate reductase [Candidatus Sericytochromatia bacterium]|nr:anaerobic ribonucleoside-triphosphate reductase [Candidatus Sericytochromatia bacterium]